MLDFGFNFGRAGRGYPDGLIAYINGLTSAVGPELVFSSADGSDPLEYKDGWSLYVGPAFTQDVPVPDPSSLADWTTKSSGLTVEPATGGLANFCDNATVMVNTGATEYAYQNVSLYDLAQSVTLYIEMDDGGVPIAGSPGDFFIKHNGFTNPPTTIEHIGYGVYKVTASVADIATKTWCGVAKYSYHSDRSFKFSGLNRVKGIGQFPYLPTQTTQVDTTGTSGGNGYSVEMSGEVADGVELGSNTSFANWTNDNPDDFTTIGEVGSDPMVTQVPNGARFYSTLVSNRPVIQQANTLTVGERYKLTMVISDYVSGTCGIGDATQNNALEVSSDGEFSAEFTAASRSLDIRKTAYIEPCDFVVTSFSVQKLIPYENEDLLSCYRGQYGAELAPNSTFDTDEDLTLVGCSVTGGKLIFDGTSVAYRYCRQSYSFDGGVEYKVDLSDVDIVSGFFQFLVAGGSTQIFQLSNGMPSFTFTATEGDNLFEISRTTGVLNSMSLGGISIKKYEPIPMTAAVTVRMTQDSTAVTGPQNIVTVNDTAVGLIYMDAGGTIKCTDGTNVASVTVAGGWLAGDYMTLRLAATETTLTMGYALEGATVITDGTAVPYDSSFDPSTHIRYGYSVTQYGNLQFQQWNRTATDAEVLKLVDKVMP